MAEDPDLRADRAVFRGRLRARPQAVVDSGVPLAPGVHSLGLDTRRDAILIVPETLRPNHPAPFLVSLHGAGGEAERTAASNRPFAEAFATVVLVPASRLQTWDAIGRGRFGPDIGFIDRALAAAFSQLAVDPTRLAIGGFSDGASYALTLGIANGNLFTHIVAYSPGFMVPPSRHGSPDVFVSHGIHDQVLPIDCCSRRIVPELRRDGYKVEYVEFDGLHAVPPDIARRAMAWFTTG